MSDDAPCLSNTLMAKSYAQVAREIAEANPDASKEKLVYLGLMYKVDKTEGSIEDRQLRFKQELSLFVSKYGSSMISEFFNYWSELNKSGTKMRFETEKTWELSKRLKRWADNKKNYGNRNNFSRQREENGDAESLFRTADEILQAYQ